MADDQTRKYGEDNPELTISYQGFVNGDNVGELVEAPVASTSANILSNVGIYPIVLSKVEDSNYEFIYQQGTLEIVKALLSVSALNKTREYGMPNPTLEFVITDFKNQDDERVLLGRPSVYTDAKSTSSVGEYPIYVEGGAARNYDFVYSNGILTIEKALLTAKLMHSTRTYGAENEFHIIYSGFRNSEKSSVIDDEPIVLTSADIYSDTGKYSLKLDGGEAQNYAFAFQYEDGGDYSILTIEKAPLEITADDKEIGIGDPLPVFSMSFTGFLNGDNSDDLDYFPYISSPNANVMVKGDYPIILEDGHDNNYEYFLINGTLHVGDTTGILQVFDDSNDDTNIQIFTLSGLCIYSGTKRDAKLEPGIYIIRKDNKSFKIYVK